MDVLKAMRAFVACVEGGSFIAAADKLDTSTAAISRQIAALEAHLGARLMNRTTRRLSLTEAGQTFHERAAQVVADVAEAEAVAGAQSVRPQGLLRISAPLSFGTRTLGKLLPDFRKRYPDIRLDLDLTDRLVDLTHEGIDLALRIARAPSPNLIVRKIAPVRIIACATPQHLDRFGRPEVPEDLIAHPTLSYAYLTSGDAWTFRREDGALETVRITPAVRATNGDLLKDLAIEAGGVIVQPDFIVADDIAAGRLERIMPDWEMEAFNLYAVYLSRKFLSAKARVFIDFLVDRLGHPA